MQASQSPLLNLMAEQEFGSMSSQFYSTLPTTSHFLYVGYRMRTWPETDILCLEELGWKKPELENTGIERMQS